MKKFIKLMCLFSIGLLIPMLIVNADCSSNIPAPFMVEYEVRVVNPDGAKTYNIGSDIPEESGFTIPYNTELLVKEEYDADGEIYLNVQNDNSLSSTFIKLSDIEGIADEPENNYCENIGYYYDDVSYHFYNDGSGTPGTWAEFFNKDEHGDFYVLSSEASVYAGAGLGNKIVGKLNQGTKLNVQCYATHDTTWLYIDNGDIKGFVNAYGGVVGEKIEGTVISTNINVYDKPNSLKYNAYSSFENETGSCGWFPCVGYADMNYGNNISVVANGASINEIYKLDRWSNYLGIHYYIKSNEISGYTGDINITTKTNEKCISTSEIELYNSLEDAKYFCSFYGEYNYEECLANKPVSILTIPKYSDFLVTEKDIDSDYKKITYNGQDYWGYYSSCFDGTLEENINKYFVIKDIEIKETYDENSNTLGTIPKGALVNLQYVKSLSNTYYVNYNGISGYVIKSYDYSEKTHNMYLIEEYNKKTYTNIEINLYSNYSDADSSLNSIGKISEDESFTLNYSISSTDVYNISYNGQDYYINISSYNFTNHIYIDNDLYVKNTDKKSNSIKKEYIGIGVLIILITLIISLILFKYFKKKRGHDNENKEN